MGKSIRKTEDGLPIFGNDTSVGDFTSDGLPILKKKDGGNVSASPTPSQLKLPKGANQGVDFTQGGGIPSLVQQQKDAGLLQPERKSNFADYLRGDNTSSSNVLPIQSVRVGDYTKGLDVEEAIKTYVGDNPNPKEYRKGVEKEIKKGALVPVKDNSGKTVLKPKASFVESLFGSVDKMHQQEIENKFLVDASDKDGIEYLNRTSKYPSTGIVKEDEKALGGIGGFIGENLSLLLKGTVGALAGAYSGATGGSSFGTFLTTAQEMANSGYANSLKNTYYKLKEQNPEISDQEAYAKAKKAALGGEAVSLVEGAVSAHSLPKIPEPQVSVKGVWDGITKSVKHSVKAAPKVLGTSAVGSVGRDVSEMAQGVEKDLKEIQSNASESVKNMAVMHFGLMALTEPYRIPSYIRPQVENIVASAPRNEVEKVYKSAEAEGALPKGTTEQVLEKLERFDKAKAVTENLDIPEENKAAIAGKLLQREKLVEQQRELSKLAKKGEEETTGSEAFTAKLKSVESEIKKIDSDIDKMSGEENALKFEKDKRTFSDKVSVIMPEEMSRPETVTISAEEVNPETKKSSVSVILPETNTKPEIVEKVTDQTTETKTINNEKERQERGLLTSEAKDGGNVAHPPTEPLVSLSESDNAAGITQAAQADRREAMGLGEYSKERETFKQWESEARQMLADGYDVYDLYNRMEKDKYNPTPQENAIRKIYVATLDKAIAENPTDALLKERKRQVEIDNAANSRAGVNLVSLKGYESPLETLGDFYVAKMEANNVDKLTEAQKAEVKQQYEELQKAKAESDAKLMQLQEAYDNLLAEKEFNKIKSEPKRAKKSKDDFVKERKSIAESIKDKWAKASNDGTLTAVPIPYAKQLAAIAPDVAKLMRSYVEEGVIELAEVVKRIHSDLKEVVEDITEKDVRDLIAGVYNEKKKTRSELSAKLRDLKDEQVLLNKLELLLKGEEPKNERAKVERNRQIKELRDKIKAFRLEEKEANTFYGESESGNRNIERMEDELQRLKERREKEPKESVKREVSEREQKLKDEIAAERKKIKEEEKEANTFYREELPEDVKKLQSAISRVKKSIEATQEKIKKGEFEKEERPKSIWEQSELKNKYPRLFKEAKEARDKLLNVKDEIIIQRLKDEYSKEKWVGKKGLRVLGQALNSGRALKSSFDVSMPFRQGLWGMAKQLISFPIENGKLTFRQQKELGQEFVKMYRALASEKYAKSVMNDIHSNPRYELAQKSGLGLLDPDSPLSKFRDEHFQTSLIEKVPFIGKPVDLKIGDKTYRGGGLINASNRAATTFTNLMKFNLFNELVDTFVKQGKTFENAKELYEAAAVYANQSVGRGKLPQGVEKANEVSSKIFFSLKLQASRLQLMTYLVNPRFYTKIPPEIRRAYIEDMIKTVFLCSAALGVAKAMGLTVGANPFASNFGKIRYKDTEIDVWGGFQQWAVFLMRLAVGKKANTKGQNKDTNRGDLIMRFARSKASPELGSLTDGFQGKDYLGNKVTPQEVAVNYVSPLAVSDIQQSAQKYSAQQSLILWLLSTHGVGVQTYGEKQNNK